MLAFIRAAGLKTLQTDRHEVRCRSASGSGSTSRLARVEPQTERIALHNSASGSFAEQIELLRLNLIFPVSNLSDAADSEKGAGSNPGPAARGKKVGSLKTSFRGAPFNHRTLLQGACNRQVRAIIRSLGSNTGEGKLKKENF